MNANGLNMVRLALANATFQAVPKCVRFINFHFLTQLPNALYFLLGAGVIHSIFFLSFSENLPL